MPMEPAHDRNHQGCETAKTRPHRDQGKREVEAEHGIDLGEQHKANAVHHGPELQDDAWPVAVYHPTL